MTILGGSGAFKLLYAGILEAVSFELFFPRDANEVLYVIEVKFESLSNIILFSYMV